MRISRILVCLALASPTLLAAQTFEPLRSSGELGLDFTRPASKRYRAKENRDRVRGRDALKERRRHNDFALSTAVALSRHHRSGQVLSGDWVSRLVDSLGQRIVAASSLAGGPPVRFYVVASPGVNAFATADRTVYVTMGLLARVESEAQLALVLSHELGHIEHDHSLDFYLERADYADHQRSLRRRDREDDPFAVNRYSRDNEVEADDYGFDLYARLGYSGLEGMDAFEVLRYSAYPFSDYRLRPGDLAALGLDIDEGHFLDELVEPARRGDEEPNDEHGETLSEEERAERIANRSTHPALEDRLAEATARLADHPGKRFILWSLADLAAIRRQARYETTDYLLRDFANPEAAQAALALMAEDPEPDVPFLRRTLVQAQVNHLALRHLHGEIEARLREDAAGKNEYHVAHRRLEAFDDFPGAESGHGEAQRLYHVLSATPLGELADVVLAQALALARDYPDMASAHALIDRTIEVVQAVEPRAYDAWAAGIPEARALDPGMDLADRFRSAREVADLEAWNREDAERIEKTARRGPSAPVRDLLVLAPYYTYGEYSLTGGDAGENLERTELGEVRQERHLAEGMRSAGIRGQVLSDRLGRGDAEELNDLRTGLEWVGQFNRLEALRLVPHNHDRMLALLDERGTEYVARMWESDSRMAGFARGLSIYGDVLMYLAFSPFDAVASIVSPRTQRSLHHLVIHPESRSITFSQGMSFRTRQGEASRRAIDHELFDGLSTGSGRGAGYLGRRHLVELGADIRVLKFSSAEAANNTPGVRLGYRYAVTRNMSLGATARFAGYEVAQGETAGSEVRRFSSRQMAAELEWHGSRTGANTAPLGLFLGLGVGLSTITSDATATEIEASHEGGYHPIPSGSEAFGSMSVGYRYVLADRYTVAPFARLNVGGHGIRFPGRSKFLAQTEGLQTGVRIGLVW